MKTFIESERFCEASFLSGGHFSHAFTSGKNTPLLFATEDDFRFAMNVIAQSAARHPEVKILAFEVMSNHFHFVVSSHETELSEFWNFIRSRISRFYPDTKGLGLSVKPIEGLQSLRSHIVYVNRNGYVADHRYTPFSYPWGTGRYYFMDNPQSIELRDVFTVEKRRMFRSRTPDLPDHWLITNGYIIPSSFCAVSYGMAMFRDAHHYYYFLNKNIESYNEIATELDDSEFLTDSELFVQLSSVLKTDYATSTIKTLSKAQKFDLARRLRQTYRSSNGQIRRVLGLSQYDIDSLFPLAARPEK